MVQFNQDNLPGNPFKFQKFQIAPLKQETTWNLNIEKQIIRKWRCILKTFAQCIRTIPDHSRRAHRKVHCCKHQRAGDILKTPSKFTVISFLAIRKFTLQPRPILRRNPAIQRTVSCTRKKCKFIGQRNSVLCLEPAATGRCLVGIRDKNSTIAPVKNKVYNYKKQNFLKICGEASSIKMFTFILKTIKYLNY